MKYPYSVDPNNIPEALSNPQLEFFVLFAICVAGKSAAQTFEKLDAFLNKNRYSGTDEYDETPFETIHKLVAHNCLRRELEAARFGQYERIETAMRGAALLDVEHLTLDDLESVPGIGPKSARFVILYSDPKAQCVPLDTHILKYLRSIGYVKAPATTPPAGRMYEYLEQAFVQAANIQKMTVRQLDTEVWKAYSSKQEITPQPSKVA